VLYKNKIKTITEFT